MFKIAIALSALCCLAAAQPTMPSGPPPPDNGDWSAYETAQPPPDGLDFPQIDFTAMGVCATVNYTGFCKDALGSTVLTSDGMFAAIAPFMEKFLGPAFGDIIKDMLGVQTLAQFQICKDCMDAFKKLFCLSVVPGCGFFQCMSSATQWQTCQETAISSAACAGQFPTMPADASGGGSAGASGGGSFTMPTSADAGTPPPGFTFPPPGKRSAPDMSLAEAINFYLQRTIMRHVPAETRKRGAGGEIVEITGACADALSTCDKNYLFPACGHVFLGAETGKQFVNVCSCGKASSISSIFAMMPPNGMNFTISGSCNSTTNWCSSGSSRVSCDSDQFAVGNGQVCMGSPSTSTKQGSSSKSVSVPNAPTSAPKSGSSGAASVAAAAAVVAAAAVFAAAF